MNTEEIGARALKLRKKQKLTQVELASITGLNKNTIYNLENGRLASVTVETLEVMAVPLKTSVAYLLGKTK